MSTHAVVRTAEELLHMPDDGMRYELIAGDLRMMPPPGFEHGRVAMTAGRLLSTHVHAAGLGVTVGAETGFLIATDPDTVRAPDTAFVRRERAEAVGRTFKYWPGAPDFAIEVVSPDDSRRYVREKALNWVEAGASALLVLDPRTRSATVYRAGGEVSTHTASSPEGDDVLDLSDAVPGWRVAVADFFA
jgi:Uma2 family endonuclease